MTSGLRARWEAHYASGHTPWDTQVTPPEVEAFWASGRLPPYGIALDVGCGAGTNVLYLARLGLLAIGVDIAAHALSEGYRRIHELTPYLWPLSPAPPLTGGEARPSPASAQQPPSPTPQACLVQADVTSLPFAGGQASYILDLGCSHGLPPTGRRAFAEAIVGSLQPGGYYHLYAFDYVARPDAGPEDWSMGMGENEVVERFTPPLEVVEITRARPDRHPCRWYLLRRKDNRPAELGASG